MVELCIVLAVLCVLSVRAGRVETGYMHVTRKVYFAVLAKQVSACRMGHVKRLCTLGLSIIAKKATDAQ